MIGRLRISDLMGSSIFGESPRQFGPSRRMPDPRPPVWRRPGRVVLEVPSLPRETGIINRALPTQPHPTPTNLVKEKEAVVRRLDFDGRMPRGKGTAGAGGVSRIRHREMGLSDTVAATASPATPQGGFWANIGTTLSNAVSSLLPVVTQVQAQKYLAKQQSQLLTTQGNLLYTPQNIQTLQSQAEFEAAQRRVDFGRQTGSMSLPLSGTTLAIIGGGALALYLAMRKK